MVRYDVGTEVYNEGIQSERLYVVFKEWYHSEGCNLLINDVMGFEGVSFKDKVYEGLTFYEKAYEALSEDLVLEDYDRDTMSPDVFEERKRELQQYLISHPFVISRLIKQKFIMYALFNHYFIMVEEEGGVKHLNEPFQPTW